MSLPLTAKESAVVDFAETMPEAEIFSLRVTEDDCIDLAAGVVPNVVKSMAKMLLDFEDHIRRSAARPVRKAKR